MKPLETAAFNAAGLSKQGFGLIQDGSLFAQLLPSAITLPRDDNERSRTFYAMLVATALAALVFLGWPTHIPRPTPTTEGWAGFAWSALFWFDTPRNCFPSLHVALAALAGWSLWRSGHRAAAIIWPALISLSTLTTRQHVAWDVAGGLVLAPLAWTLTTRYFRYDRAIPTHHAAGA